MFAWVREGRTDEAQDAAGWSGVQAFPRELELDDAGRLISKPITEIAQLRGEPYLIEAQTLRPDDGPVDLFESRQFEMALTVAGAEGRMTLDLLASPNGSERTQIGCDLAAGEVWLDTTQSSRSEDTSGVRQQLQLPGGKRESLSIHLLVDHSMIEVWFDGGYSLTGRAYPTAADAQGVRLSAEDGTLSIRNLSAWEMDSIW
jgi:beta-fructofuranosidase